MLYVFQMDIGQMLTFDMSLLMDTVGKLQTEIYKTTGISVEQQILLLSGGQSLKADQKVMAYGAGADTNPVFLFSKLAIESQDPPVIRSFITSKDAFITLKERVTDALKMRPSYDTVNLRAKLAVQIRDSANGIYSYCKNEFQEQHLQHQGWGAVIANLEEIADALQKTEIKFNKVYNSFLSSKETHFQNLNGFGVVLDLIGRIPLLESLKEPGENVDSNYKGSDKSLACSFHVDPKTLLEWICSQAQSQGIDSLHKKCEEDLKMFNESMFESYDKQVQELLSVVRMDPNQMKELVGIERRLSELEKRLNEAKRIATTQNDLAQGFIKHQSKLGSFPDVSGILPDLCESHKQQLSQMLEAQQRIIALQNNFRNSKQEMSRNIHQRLGWVMHVETKIAKLDSELIFHIKKMKVLECNLDLLTQIKISPTVYADLVVETARRKKFSDRFSQWADVLEEGSNRLYDTEKERRKIFSHKYGDHFLLHTMFKGFDDKPPNITTKVPRLFDANLPEITADEISWLKSSVPELEESLSFVEETDQFPSDLPCTYSSDKMSFNAKHASSFPNVQISHTPCVVTATEGPATPFTVPELHGKSDHKPMPNTGLTTVKKDVAVETTVKKSVDKASQDRAIISIMKETQTSVTFLSHENKGVGTEELERDSPKPAVGAKPVSATDSSSPLSSTEFATADFYFEESMPSPMVESSADRKVDEQTKSMLKESLDNQLKEKGLVIEELNALLEKKEAEISKLQTEVRTLKGENSEEHLEFFSLIGPLDEACPNGKEASSTEVESSKEMESAGCQTESWISVDDRVKDLEQKLEKLTVDLDQSQLSLMKAEENLKTVQEQEQAVNEKNDMLKARLEEEVSVTSNALVETKKNLELKEAEVMNLKDSLSISKKQETLYQKDLEISNENMKTLQNKFKELISLTRQNIPALREDLQNLKIVVKNTVQLEDFKSTSMINFEKEVASFSCIVLNLEKERELLKGQVNNLQEEIKTIASGNESESSNLRLQIDSLKAELTKQEEHFAAKYSQQKNDFDNALQDLETKHALETELELDKCKADIKELIVEWERKFDEEKDAKDKLSKDLDAATEEFEREKDKLKQMHQTGLTELEARLKDFNEKCVRDLQEQLDDSKGQVQTLETEAAATAVAVNKEKEDCLAELQKTLGKEFEDRMLETTQGHEEQLKQFAQTIEELQLNHAYKLAELKKNFDHERDLFQAELKKYKDNEMINSQTQTERELLAEVISLTSSASDGMEELTSVKVQDEVETGAKQKSLVEPEANTSKELENAQETIRSMDEKMKTLVLENEELKGKLRYREEEASVPQAASVEETDRNPDHNMMQASAIGRSFILMDKDKQADLCLGDTDEMKLKDQKIAHLEKHIMELSMTASGRSQNPDKISFRGCDIGDLVLLCLDEKHDQYVVFTVGTNLHFLHSESLDGLGLKSAADPASKKPWILAKVMDKEYCLAKKPNNRFRVPQGTCFYRVKCQPWKCEVDLTKHKDMDSAKQKKADPSGTGSADKKADIKS